MTRAVLVLLLVGLGATPAAAVPSCLGSGGTYPIGENDLPSETLQVEQDIENLRTRGIRALTAVRTGFECIEITRRVEGRVVTEYYDPSSFKRVE